MFPASQMHGVSEQVKLTMVELLGEPKHLVGGGGALREVVGIPIDDVPAGETDQLGQRIIEAVGDGDRFGPELGERLPSTG